MATSQNGRAGSTPISTTATSGRNAAEAEAEAVDLRSGTRRSAAAVTPDVEPAPREPVSTSLMGALKRTVKEFKKDNLSDWAAALTYRAVMCMAPALLVIVAALGLLGKSTTNKLIANIGTLAPGGVKSTLNTVITSVQGKSTAGLAGIIGIALALYSASSYIAAFMRASNAIYRVGEGRPVWKTIPVRIAVTIVLVVMLVISAAIVVFSGPIATKTGKALGISPTLITVFEYAKWPVLIIIVSAMLAILYYAAPNVKQPGIKWVSPGGLLAVIVWVVASALFAFYVANFGSYNKTYGALASVIIFLIWLWITNVAILLGAEFNAEIQRGHAVDAGESTGTDAFAEPRDTRKLDDDTQAQATALAQKQTT
jgi:membrane protein